MWHMGDGWGWWMLVGWLWMVLLIAAIVWAVYAMTERTEPRRPDREPDALQILERRYARGELTHEQFEEMRARLQRPGSPPL